MNRRQKKKKHKREWQQMLSYQYRTVFHLNVKPSRVKTRIVIAPKTISVFGAACGMEIEFKFTEKEQEGHEDN